MTEPAEPVEIDDQAEAELLTELGGVNALRMGADHPYDPADEPDGA